MSNNVLLSKKVFGTARLNVRFPNSNVLLLVKIKRDIAQDKIEEVVFKVSKKHRLINSNIKMDNDNDLYYQINDFMQPEIYSNQNTETVNKIMIKEFKRPFDLEKGPLIRFNIIKDSRVTHLLICCHHVICDGLSLVYLANDMLEVIVNPQKEVSEVKMPVLQDAKTIPEKIKKNFLTKLVVNSINKKWVKRELLFTKVIYDDICSDFWTKHNPGIVSWELSQEQTAQLIKKSKKNGITVNSALTTVFLRAESAELEKKEYSDDVIVSVSLREYLKEDPEDTMGFYAAAVRPKLKYLPNKGFWSNAISFHKKIKRLITKDNVFESQAIGLFHPKYIDALALGRFGRCNDKAVSKMIEKKKMNVINSTFTLTNLGKINLSEDLSQLQLSSIIGPAVYGDTMEKYIGVITINGQMFFSISFNQNIVGKDRIEAIKNRVIEYIRAM